MMPIVLRTILLTLILALSACAAFDGMQTRPADPDEQTDTTPEPPPAPEEAATKCQWEEIRGIAELLSIENGTGHFLFYPGEIEVSSDVQAGWQPGQEYKSILKQPQGENCPPARLESLEPLEVD